MDGARCLNEPTLEPRGTGRLYIALVTRDSPVSPPRTPVGRPVRDNAGIHPHKGNELALQADVEPRVDRHEAIWTRRRS